MRIQERVSHAAMDCHRTFSRLTARDAENRVLFRRRLEHKDRAAMRNQFKLLPAATPVIIEGTFGWGWMADELEACGLRAYLSNSRAVDGWRKSRGLAKTNTIDADLLSELWLERPHWWNVWLAPREVRDQREWLRYRMGLVHIQTMTKCRIHATLQLRQEAEISRHIGTGLLPQELANRGSPARLFNPVDALTRKSRYRRSAHSGFSAQPLP